MARWRDDALKDQMPEMDKDRKEETEGDPEKPIREKSSDDQDMNPS